MSGKHILAVDDEALILLEIEATLSMQGHKVSLATSVDEAITVLDKGGIDLAVVDYHLREGNGDNLVERLQAAAVPFVVCSGVPGLQELATGFADAPFLSKPYTAAELLDVVAKVHGC